MKNGINRAMLMGNLGADPELRTTQGGQSVCELRMATTTQYKDKDGNYQDNTQWHQVTVWGKRGEGLAKILSKGSTVYVEGEIGTRSYEDKEGVKRYVTSITASNVIPISGFGNGESGGTQRNQARGGGSNGRKPGQGNGNASGGNGGGDPFGGDDIPF